MLSPCITGRIGSLVLAGCAAYTPATVAFLNPLDITPITQKWKRRRVTRPANQPLLKLFVRTTRWLDREKRGDINAAREIEAIMLNVNVTTPAVEHLLWIEWMKLRSVLKVQAFVRRMSFMEGFRYIDWISLLIKESFYFESIWNSARGRTGTFPCFW